jgi:uncharacterized protein YydD (DUF2326 family)
MFIERLIISSNKGEIRNIKFRSGLNLIVDESENKVTGNNVGKTTVLKLIDFCLGANKKIIYTSPEDPKAEYQLVKDFLIKEDVLIQLTLSRDLDDPDAERVYIEKNFLTRSNKIQSVNGNNLINDDDFERRLFEVFFPENVVEKPSFRQIISHNIRYTDHSLHRTLKTLHPYTSNTEYETLYLYLLGCDFVSGDERQKVISKLNQEKNYKNRLEKSQPKTAYETRLSVVEIEIDELIKEKQSLNINETFEEDLNRLDGVKFDINSLSSQISQSKIKKELILEMEEEIKESSSDIDTEQLHIIYNQASGRIQDLQKTFDDLLSYHNRMVEEKIKFVRQELPEVEAKIEVLSNRMSALLDREKELTAIVTKSDSYEELEDIISRLNEKNRRKGELETVINQIEDVESDIDYFEKRLEDIDKALFSDDFEQLVRTKVDSFNTYFRQVSSYLYDEQYLLNYVIEKNRKGQKVYKFDAFNTNLSTGKKQGEISSFDIAYILYAEEENMNPVRFLLNDKKELMYDDQLVSIKDIVEEKNIQFLASILKDKLPDELNDEKFFSLQLSQDDKLFRIES